jgi:hypothetical protein
MISIGRVEGFSNYSNSEKQVFQNNIRNGEIKSRNQEIEYFIMSDSVNGKGAVADPQNPKYYLGDNSYDYMDAGALGKFVLDGEYFNGRNRDELFTQKDSRLGVQNTLFTDGTNMWTNEKTEGRGGSIFNTEGKPEYYYNSTNNEFPSQVIKSTAQMLSGMSSIPPEVIKNVTDLSNFSKSVFQYQTSPDTKWSPDSWTNKQNANYTENGKLVSGMVNGPDGSYKFIDQQGRPVYSLKSNEDKNLGMTTTLYDYKNDGTHSEYYVNSGNKKDSVYIVDFDSSGNKVKEYYKEKVADGLFNISNIDSKSGETVGGTWVDPNTKQVYTYERTYNADGTYKQDLKDSSGKVTFSATWDASGKNVIKESTAGKGKEPSKTEANKPAPAAAPATTPAAAPAATPAAAPAATPAAAPAATPAAAPAATPAAAPAATPAAAPATTPAAAPAATPAAAPATTPAAAPAATPAAAPAANGK